MCLAEWDSFCAVRVHVHRLCHYLLFVYISLVLLLTSSVLGSQNHVVFAEELCQPIAHKPEILYHPFDNSVNQLILNPAVEKYIAVSTSWDSTIVLLYRRQCVKVYRRTELKSEISILTPCRTVKILLRSQPGGVEVPVQPSGSAQAPLQDEQTQPGSRKKRQAADPADGLVVAAPAAPPVTPARGSTRPAAPVDSSTTTIPDFSTTTMSPFTTTTVPEEDANKMPAGGQVRWRVVCFHHVCNSLISTKVNGKVAARIVWRIYLRNICGMSYCLLVALSKPNRRYPLKALLQCRYAAIITLWKPVVHVQTRNIAA